LKQVLLKQGQTVVEEVPAPQVEPGTVLVRVKYSCISIGTEMAGIRSSGLPLWKRAMKQPEKVKKVLEMVAAQGLTRTTSLVKGKLTSGAPIGYSASGTVLAAGEGITDLSPRDRVACAGSQWAHHAEIIRVPRNLAVPIPEALDLLTASTVTLGAIALQGVRRAQPTLGETFVVIGLGILGQLTCQILKANGCHVIGTDPQNERVKMAQNLGLNYGVVPESDENFEQVSRLTDGTGADGVIITAASSSNAIISMAFKMCRKKGRVVLVGDVGLNLDREDFYRKELDFFISTSYGPGRYDNVYEEQGLDYPVAYVRWTENRNMASYLNLLVGKQVNVAPLISEICPIEHATGAYEKLKTGAQKPLMIILSYPDPQADGTPSRVVATKSTCHPDPGKVGLAVVGAGAFAKEVHLPNLLALSDRYELRAVVSRTGHNALMTATQFGASYATTDYEQVLNDPTVTAVLIATRHNLHAPMALAALKAGKHVLLEKPLAVNTAQLTAVRDFYSSTEDVRSAPILMTGFNRRFSIFIRRIYELIKNRSNPMVINYRMNAGYIPMNHWVHTEEGGGRNIGEACHIYDLFTHLTNSKVLSVDAKAIKPSTAYYIRSDNFITTMTFEDGSLANLTYTALGSKDYPKERMDIFVDGKVLFLDDYKKLLVLGAKVKGIESKFSDKGQKEELVTFACFIQNGGEWPIPLWQQIQATEIALMVENLLHARNMQ
jgi:predicted dehydrogenase/threonine dehydrogenase-like Zn-dependent dehydrogenase